MQLLALKKQTTNISMTDSFHKICIEPLIVRAHTNFRILYFTIFSELWDPPRHLLPLPNATGSLSDYDSAGSKSWSVAKRMAENLLDSPDQGMNNDKFSNFNGTKSESDATEYSENSIHSHTDQSSSVLSGSDEHGDHSSEMENWTCPCYDLDVKWSTVGDLKLQFCLDEFKEGGMAMVKLQNGRICKIISDDN